MTGVGEGYNERVFTNCPFDQAYLPLLRPLLFTIVYLGFVPRIASASSDSGELRLHKICQFIRESRFSIHDLSRLEADMGGEYYRMNMPFELGIDYGCRAFADGHLRQKRCLILEERRYEYMKALSDLAGVDIKDHGGEPMSLVRQVRNWFLETAGVQRPPSPTLTWRAFNAFMVDFRDKRKTEGFSDEDLEGMPVAELIGFMEEWVQENRGAAG